MELDIRKIDPEDIIQVYELLVQLARHEKIEVGCQLATG